MSILSRVQLNPEIGSDNASFVSDLIQRAQDFIVSYCNLHRFPISAQGYAISGASAGTDLTELSSDWLYVSMNGSGRQRIVLDLSSCTDGEATAAELQRAIRESGINDYGFDEVTCSFNSDDSQYTVTSGRYGEYSWIGFGFDESAKHVCQALKLTREYGGKEYAGSESDDVLETACVMLVEQKYRQLGLEGLKSGSVPGGVSFTAHDLDPVLKEILQSRRRL